MKRDRLKLLEWSGLKWLVHERTLIILHNSIGQVQPRIVLLLQVETRLVNATRIRIYRKEGVLVVHTNAKTRNVFKLDLNLFEI